MFYSREIETIGEYDIIVAGGGPAGIGAAVAAADMGMKVLIIERAGILGGNLTIGHVSPISGGHVKNTMAQHIKELIAGKNCDTNNFDGAKIKLIKLIAEKGICAYLNSSVCDVVRDGEEIKSVIISTQSGLKNINAKFFIDATGDGVLSYLAGESVEYGRDDGLVQPNSVMFTILGVDLDQKMLCYAEDDDTQLKKGSYLKLCKDACKAGELPPEIDIVRLYPAGADGERVVNATQVNRLNPLIPEDYFKAQVKLRNQIHTVMQFLKNNVEGFENIRIKDSSDIVGVRESRRIVGQYTLTAEDLIAGRRFEDVIVHKADFAIDIHNPDGAGQAESDTIPVRIGNYDIPYGCIVPLENRNLYTAGRCISGTHRAHASYRVMNIAMNLGEAAGVAAAVCIREKSDNKAVGYKKVQTALAERGIDLFE